MSWNYRVVKKKFENGFCDYSIYEVYYDEFGNIKMWSAEPVTLEAFENTKDINNNLKLIRKALNRPTLLLINEETLKEI